MTVVRLDTAGPPRDRDLVRAEMLAMMDDAIERGAVRGMLIWEDHDGAVDISRSDSVTPALVTGLLMHGSALWKCVTEVGGE